MLTYRPTPVQVIEEEEWNNAGVNVLVKREDLNHPFVSGNKWWKLKYNLEQAIELGYDTLLTFGGAYSNHIYATAAAAKEVNLKSIGIIRGDELKEVDNPTLLFAASQGMELHFVSREDYRNKNENQFHTSLKENFGNIFIIPEGGTNAFAIQGTEEFGIKLQAEIEFDVLFVAGGTGGTATGLALAMPDKKVKVVSALKGNFLIDEISSLIKEPLNNIEVLNDYHFGGYAKYNQILLDFIAYWDAKQLPLEHVYTAKVLYALDSLIKKKYFKAGTKILMLHSGGLQGKLA
ncbi:MAG: pyridoxal-phosphate dependent enzyme [Cyclobacteriaceae bacterium]|jgi:1-aminocyclopropane-1-carboxylate deaminase|nr:pyridoxal-phosphate dependent enzyme [Cyclobacteriaceae bacterium]